MHDKLSKVLETRQKGITALSSLKDRNRLETDISILETWHSQSLPIPSHDRGHTSADVPLECKRRGTVQYAGVTRARNCVLMASEHIKSPLPPTPCVVQRLVFPKF